MDTSIAPAPLRIRDYLLIGVFAAVLFGYAGVGGRPLTMHEARLPQTSREMLATHRWLLPHSGIRPWLERPPLPHWIVIGSMKLFGHDDRVWVVRLPSAIMGVIIVLVVGWMSGRWFGRTIGVVAALVLATSFEFYSYASLAEDDIYLGALVTICVAFFASAEFFSPAATADRRLNVLVGRPWQVGLFFITLGLTNLTKGPLLGILIVGSSVGSYLLWNAIADGAGRALLRYVWLWGWLATIALTLAWPAWAYHVYPDVLANWKYDYLGRMSGAYTDINQGWYYYAPALAAAMAPWTPACLIGLIALTMGLRHSNERGGLREETGSSGIPSDPASVGALSNPSARAAQFVLCWAILPLIVLSIPKGKHHHYLVPFLAPWAILAAFGVVEIAAYFRWSRRTGPVVFTVILSLLLVGYCCGETFLAASTDHTVADTAFLRRVRQEVPPGSPLFINAKLGPVGNLDFFRIQFYSRPDAMLLHNLSYLRDENIKASEVYVITRARDEEKLKQLGTPTLIDQSESSHEVTTPAGRFSLFKLVFDPNLKREAAPTHITNMQAMEREPGPWCGPAL
ncbi:MAG TPA: glycosyltransferase family 39 protein [Tepidisphaeraceae bacterium]|nr:glycosyltransferase family 39 protein [Tepidisphaeraceae bacterium]